jgi:dUTP pyrophosphatase
MSIGENELIFAKVRPDAIIPGKREEDAAMDVYACFDKDYWLVKPHTTELISTGIASALNTKYYIQLEERGSTGTKGIAQRSGIKDAGFRGEWKVPITNTTEKILIIAKNEENFKKMHVINENAFDNDYILYSCGKAICQALLVPVPKIEIKEISIEELKSIPSKRGEGMLGSSNK